MRIFLLIFISVFIHANELIVLKNEPIQPITEYKNLNNPKLELGKKLFFDNRLSKDNTVSCASCHSLDKGGVDNLKKSFGFEGKEGNTNTPTVFNSSLNFVQFLDGRAKTLAEQIDGPIHNPVEMASNWTDIINKLQQDSFYKSVFKKLYKDGITENNIKNAIVHFEESLITPSRFDRYLLGDSTAISDYEKKGYLLFKNYGCSSCHQGSNIGGNIYEKIGVFKKYVSNELNENYGRYNLTGKEENRFEYKVSSLRNIDLTSPYLHNGSIDKLTEVISIMGEYQLGRDIPNEDILKIEAFLKSLTYEKLEKKN